MASPTASSSARGEDAATAQALAATRMQAVHRGRSARHGHLQRQSSAQSVQSAARGRQARLRAHRVRQERAAARAEVEARLQARAAAEQSSPPAEHDVAVAQNSPLRRDSHSDASARRPPPAHVSRTSSELERASDVMTQRAQIRAEAQAQLKRRVEAEAAEAPAPRSGGAEAKEAAPRSSSPPRTAALRRAKAFPTAGGRLGKQEAAEATEREPAPPQPPQPSEGDAGRAEEAQAAVRMQAAQRGRSARAGVQAKRVERRSAEQRRRDANVLQGFDVDESSDKSVAEQLRAELCREHVRVIDVFRTWDDDDTGSISKVEFRRGLTEMKFDATAEVMDRLFEEWEYAPPPRPAPSPRPSPSPRPRSTPAVVPAVIPAVGLSLMLKRCGSAAIAVSTARASSSCGRSRGD